jgi:hypothetical protein
MHSLKTKSKEELLELSDEELILYIQKLCDVVLSPHQIYNISIKRLRKYVKKYYIQFDPTFSLPNYILEETKLKFPYDVYYGLNKKGAPLPAFQNFIKDADLIQSVIITLAKMHTDALFSDFLFKELIKDNTSDMCHGSLLLFSHSLEELTKYKVSNHLKNHSVIFSSNIPDYVQVQDRLKYIQFQGIEKIRSCYLDKNVTIMKINLVIFTSKSSVEGKSLVNFKNNKEFIHALQIVINKETNKI